MNEPSRTEERQAADMDVDVSTMNLCDERSEGWQTTVTDAHAHALIEPGLRDAGWWKRGPRPSERMGLARDAQVMAGRVPGVCR